MDDPFVFANESATAVFVLTLVGSVLVEWLVTLNERRQTESAGAESLVGRARLAGATLVEVATSATSADKGQDRGTKRILVGSMVGALVAGVLAARRLTGLALPGNGWIWVALGAGIAWCGIALRAWAIATLGRFFRRDVTVVQDQPVVTAGPYRRLRHPAYTGNLLIALGVGLMLGNAGALLVLAVVPFLGHIPRIRVEEAALERELGNSYRDFASGRARLVPGLW
jgi:protein-S-isoprenylcysteine O-methyltransferase Ste14